MATLQQVVTVGVLTVISVCFSQHNPICPDQSQCSVGSTCCKMSSGSYGCCPMDSAVCCSDGQHCCPHNSKCDVAHNRCTSVSGLGIVRVWDTEGLVHIGNFTADNPSNQICPGSHYTCEDDMTCCPEATPGRYSCCPKPNAVCCDDRHCCPHGYKCDNVQKRCVQGENIVLWYRKIDSLILTSEEEKLEQSLHKHGSGSYNDNEVCPDHRSCSDNETCCPTAAGYGCCPLPGATCCGDKVHCCPHGSSCIDGTCIRKEEMSNGELLITESGFYDIESPRRSSVVCPDKVSVCPDGTTCCVLTSGEYGCCPYPNAVCCSDKLHCCPSGATCDTTHERCVREGQFWEFARILPAQKMKQNLILVNEDRALLTSEQVVCPDKTSACPDGTTCCLMTTGQYGCCPFPNANCCSDKLHCCPSGTVCNVSASTCTQHDRASPWLSKISSFSVNDIVGIVCPDSSTQCPSGTTCCKLPTGSYGCCPFPNAVCCSDGLHCCPQGTTCDVSHARCLKQSLVEVTSTFSLSKLYTP